MRLAVNASPEPFSNIALSVLEDAGSIGLSLLAAFHPVVTLKRSNGRIAPPLNPGLLRGPIRMDGL